MVESAQTAEPQTPVALGADETSRGQVASPSPCVPSLPSGAFWRHYLRQEPYAEEPHVWVRAGGAGQPASLPRLLLSTVFYSLLKSLGSFE